MSHRFRWITRWFGRGRRVAPEARDESGLPEFAETPVGASDGPDSAYLQASDFAPSPAPESTESLVRQVVEAQLSELAESLRIEQESLREEHASLRAEILQSVADLRENVRGVEQTVRRQLEVISSDIAQLRETVEVRIASLEATNGKVVEQVASLEAKSGEVFARVESTKQKIGEVELGLNSLATSVSEGLEATQRSFSILEESTDRRVRELRDTHAAHVSSLERSREEILTIAESSRKRLTSCVGEVAEFLETEIWSSVPLSHPVPESELRSPGWRRPIAATRHWLRRGKVLQMQLDRVSERTQSLETALRQRWEESRNRSRVLRAALDEEAGLLPALAARLKEEDPQRNELKRTDVESIRTQVERTLDSKPNPENPSRRRSRSKAAMPVFASAN